MKTDAVFTRPIRTEETSRQILSARVDTRMGGLPDWSVRVTLVNGSSRSSFSTTSTPIQRRHRHSAFIPIPGIATFTVILTGQAFYKETTGREGVIETGGVEWMRASSGVWHTGGMVGKERIKGFQLWVAMSPEFELAEPHSQYLGASDFHFAGPARVIAGEYDGVKSIVESPRGITYLDVRLKAGERWTFHRACATTSPGSHCIRGS